MPQPSPRQDRVFWAIGFIPHGQSFRSTDPALYICGPLISTRRALRRLVYWGRIRRLGRDLYVR